MEDIKNEIITLMCKNIPIIDFCLVKNFLEVDEIYHNYKKNEKYAPIGIIESKIGITKTNLALWIRNRMVPKERAILSHYIERENIEYCYEKLGYNMVTSGYGFNLTDQYWFKKKGDNITWEEGNFFDNDFIERYNPKCVFMINDRFNRTIPSINTNGMLIKKWVIEDKDRYLLKAGNSYNDEQYNEVVATALFRRILASNEYVSYEIDNNNLVWTYSKCKNFITRDTEFVPAYYILHFLESKNQESNYNKFLRCCDSLGIKNVKDYLNKMLTCDYLLANCDRHYNNFGAIRDINTLEFLDMSPIFDTGYSLYLTRPDKDEFTTKPFYLEPLKQLKLVNDLSWLKLEKLEGFEKEIESILKQNKELDALEIQKIIESYQYRLEVVKHKKEDLENDKNNYN